MPGPFAIIERLLCLDGLRLPGALLCLGAIGFMARDYAQVVGERGAWIEACLEQPQGCAGRRVFLSLVEVVALGEGTYTVRKVLTEIPIQGDSRRRHIGETVSVVAVFDPARGGLVETAPESHPQRRHKHALGLLGLGLAGLAAGLTLRPTRRGLALRG